MGMLEPECAYFYAEDGKRAALLVFDMDSSSRIPAIAEPFFQALEAEVTFTPVMTADELREGLAVAFG